MCYPNKGVSIFSESIYYYMCPVTTQIITVCMYACVDEGSILCTMQLQLQVVEF